MKRLVVNPGMPNAWEIQLRDGVTTLGRKPGNDYQIDETTVSGSHCQIIVNGSEVVVKDLDSTNGTYVNRALVREASLQSGQTLNLGSVEMLFESEVRAPVRVQLHAAISEPEIQSEAPPPIPPPLATPVDAGPAFCKFHPKASARYLCSHCGKHFCELCVTLRSVEGKTRKMCRSCGVECIALQTTATRAKQRGFYASLPGAFIYPFRGFGVVILICATIAFAALGFISGGIFGIFVKVTFYGFLFLFMQNIIHRTASDEKEPLGFPEASGLGGAAFQLAGTIGISFGLAIGLVVARFYDVEVPVAAIVAAVLLGCVYFPMAFLAVAMKDTVLAANPLVVIPSIIKIPLDYLAASILLMAVYGFRQLGAVLSGVAGGVTLSTRDMSVLFLSMGVQALWALFSMYLLTVNMRVLGLLYNANKDKLEWY